MTPTGKNRIMIFGLARRLTARTSSSSGRPQARRWAERDRKDAEARVVLCYGEV
jgi:hypothetical protein